MFRGKIWRKNKRAKGAKNMERWQKKISQYLIFFQKEKEAQEEQERKEKEEKEKAEKKKTENAKPNPQGKKPAEDPKTKVQETKAESSAPKEEAVTKSSPQPSVLSGINKQSLVISMTPSNVSGEGEILTVEVKDKKAA